MLDASGEVLLGFDARSVSPDHIASWTSYRRRDWLLRPDVAIPMSVDDQVWPAIWAPEELAREYSWVGFIQDLWESLPMLRAYAEKTARSKPRPYWIVAVSLQTASLGRADLELWSSIVLTTDPPRFDEGWSLLGFDVADRFLLSGLSNCVHRTHDDYGSLQRSFRSAINEHHLFRTLGDAEAFRRLSDNRVAEHSPFYVYALRRVCACGEWRG